MCLHPVLEDAVQEQPLSIALGQGPFEIDVFESIDRRATDETVSLPFEVVPNDDT